MPVMVRDMTLRDWFAGQALTGELSTQISEGREWCPSSLGDLATRCYDVADEMMRRRSAIIMKPQDTV